MESSIAKMGKCFCRTLAVSKVIFDFEFSNWHNGEQMDMNDILHSLYFTIEWGTQVDENDRTFDTEFTPRASQSIQTIIGINPVDKDTMEVYVDYWHFDEGEIAEWAGIMEFNSMGNFIGNGKGSNGWKSIIFKIRGNK